MSAYKYTAFNYGNLQPSFLFLWGKNRSNLLLQPFSSVHFILACWQMLLCVQKERLVGLRQGVGKASGQMFTYHLYYLYILAAQQGGRTQSS